MNESIVRIAQEHGKTPQVLFPIQNRIINWKYPLKGCGEDGKLPSPSCYFITVEDSCAGLYKVRSSLTSDMLCQLFELCVCYFNTSYKNFLTLFTIFLIPCSGETQSRNTMTPYTAMSLNTLDVHSKRLVNRTVCVFRNKFLQSLSRLKSK